MNFIKLPSDRNFITIPSNIFDDERISLGAKGLYVQLCHSKSIKSFEDITTISSSTKEDINSLTEELCNFGYITKKNDMWELNVKPANVDSIDKKITNFESKLEKLDEKLNKETEQLDKAVENLISICDKYNVKFTYSEDINESVFDIYKDEKFYNRIINAYNNVVTRKTKIDKINSEKTELNDNITNSNKTKEVIEANRKEDVKELTEKVSETLHDRIGKVIDSYNLSPIVNNLLIEYFDNWIFRKGSYGETYVMTETKSRELINLLIGFKMTEEELQECIKSAIRNEDKQFYDNRITPEVKLEKIKGIITTKYEFSDLVVNKLMEYFTKRVNKEGRFDEAEDLHGKDVHSLLIQLRNFKMTDAELLSCIQESINKEYFIFCDNRKNSSSTPTTSTFKPFDKTVMTSGSFTEEDIQKIREKAEALNEEGQKGIF